MFWTLAHNIILTKKCKEFVLSTASVEWQRMSEEVHYARLLCVPSDGSRIRVPLNKGQYMYDTKDQMEGLLQYAVC